MSTARARTREARPGEERASHEDIAPPQNNSENVIIIFVFGASFPLDFWMGKKTYITEVRVGIDFHK